MNMINDLEMIGLLTTTVVFVSSLGYIIWYWLITPILEALKSNKK